MSDAEEEFDTTFVFTPGRSSDESSFEEANETVMPSTRSEELSSAAKQAEMEAKLEIQGQTIAEQAKMLDELKAFLVREDRTAAPDGAAATAASGSSQQQLPKPIIIKQEVPAKRRHHSFNKEHLPELSPESSLKEADRWIRAFRREAERCELAEEPRASQVATLVTMLNPEVREQVGDHADIDLDAPPSSHRKDVEAILAYIEKFFAAQSDRLGAFVSMLNRKQAEGESDISP